MDEQLRSYLEAIPHDHRPLFDRLDGLIRTEHPEVEVGISYKMPTYRLGARRLHVGSWRHGLSVYGWRREECAAVIERHPSLATSKGTIRLRVQDADELTDEELLDIVRAALG